METQQVRELHNLTVSFPTSVLLQLEHLEELWIRSCSSLEVVFDLQGLNVIQLAGAFQHLSSLTVIGCDSLRHVFTPPIAKLLSRLQTLEISDCENLEAIIAKEEEEKEYIVLEGGAGGGIFILFPQLTSLSLKKLPKLLKITLQWLQGSYKNLSSLHVEHCDSLKHVFTPSTAKLLLGLEEVKIVNCENLEAIVAEEDKEEEKEGRLELGGAGGMTVILFPKLNSLFLGGLRNLLTITPKPYTFNRSSLKDYLEAGEVCSTVLRLLSIENAVQFLWKPSLGGTVFGAILMEGNEKGFCENDIITNKYMKEQSRRNGYGKGWISKRRNS
ncbi:hypothetical protein LguiB_004178 [Lonicera macranthoides]